MSGRGADQSDRLVDGEKRNKWKEKAKRETEWTNERTNERTNTWKNKCRTLVWCHHGGAIKWHTRVFQRVHPSRCIFVICFDTTCEELFGFILNVTLFTLSLFTYAKETASEASAKHVGLGGWHMYVYFCIENVIPDDFLNSNNSSWKGERAEIRTSFRFLQDMP